MLAYPAYFSHRHTFEAGLLCNILLPPSPPTKKQKKKKIGVRGTCRNLALKMTNFYYREPKSIKSE